MPGIERYFEKNPSLSRSFDVDPSAQEVPWCVATGGPRSGKTSTLKEFRLLYPQIPILWEVARAYFEEEQAKGRSIEDIRANEEEVQWNFLDLKDSAERKLDPTKPAIIERGRWGDTRTYLLRAVGQKVLASYEKKRNRPLNLAETFLAGIESGMRIGDRNLGRDPFHYKAIVIFDMIPDYQPDVKDGGVRTESPEDALAIQESLVASYAFHQDYGPRLWRMPVMSSERERAVALADFLKELWPGVL